MGGAVIAPNLVGFAQDECWADALILEATAASMNTYPGDGQQQVREKIYVYHIGASWSL